ncbi:MAG: YncE family protein [Candidatus Neomarinimicrobiota bacterium]
MALQAISGPLGARNYYLYVAAESEDEVSLIRFDGQEAEVVKNIRVGVWPVEIEGPHGLTVSPDGAYWYLSVAHGFPYGHVYKYSTGDDQWAKRVELDLFPATMQVSPATGLLYVVNFNLHGEKEPSSVSVIDPETMMEVDRIETGVMPHGSRLSRDGLMHYSVAMMDGELYEIDAVTFAISRKLYLGRGDSASGAMPMTKPTWVYPDPGGEFVYVTNNGTDEVVEVALKEWRITRRFKTGKGPYNCEVSHDGKLLVVTYKSEAATAVWDLRAGKELARLANTRKVTHGVVISPDDRYAFVSVEGVRGEPGSVDVIDLHTLSMVASAEVGKQAGGIAFWKMED